MWVLLPSGTNAIRIHILRKASKSDGAVSVLLALHLEAVHLNLNRGFIPTNRYIVLKA